MPKEKQNKQNKPGEEKKEGYIIIPNYFLREWVSKLGIGPALLYLQLLSYCHKEKDIAWPTLTTLSSKLGISKNSLLSYRKILLKYGLIKKIVKRRTAQGNYQSNFYKITPIEGGAKIELRQVQILGGCSANIAPGVVQNLHPNNTNLNNTNTTTTTKREKDAVVAVVNFKKLKEKGEERMRAPYNSKEHYTGQAIKERLRDLDFKESFIEKLLKDYPAKKIEKKLDLLMEKKNIQNPAGWLMAALKNDYQDEERGRYDEESADQENQPIRMDSRVRLPVQARQTGGNDIIPNVKCRGTMHRALNESGIDPSSTENTNTPEWTSREAALRAIKLIQDNLSLPVYPSLSPQGEEP